METGVDATLFNAAALVLVTAGAVILMNLLWPSSHPHEMLWMVAPRDVECQRIRRLVLPLEALRFDKTKLPTASTSKAASVVQRIIPESFSTTTRRQQQAVDHSWTSIASKVLGKVPWKVPWKVPAIIPARPQPKLTAVWAL